MSTEQGAFVRRLLDYADRAHDNHSGRVAVPEVVLRDAAAVIEDYRLLCRRSIAAKFRDTPITVARESA